MQLLALLITVLVTWILFSSWQRLRRVQRPRRHATELVRDDESGLAELALPAGWRPARTLNEATTLQAADPLRGRFAIVISESRDDFEPAMDLEEHSVRTRAVLASSVQVVAVRGPFFQQIGGFDAVQYEMDATHDLRLLTYLHTTIAGDRAFHQVLGWATRSRYKRASFEALMAGFREMPGEERAEPPKTTVPLEVSPMSRFPVH